ncbi:thiamine phosphate synthase [Hymenobacter sp. BT523]|uniref:thiamine phosphate synthase n=1 Tax=Hymenobacter sp. BT523 TaxID=2795725 RepID=UPI0018EBFDDB|nr:thiamine phosphate synthase [Hymenobacter sp. BT523]MBJ6109036.1 thiamine phosphate synthase [Hymenobacter sp. BT523]
MRLLVISPPHSVPHETALVSQLLAAGLARFHVRKPGWEQGEIAAYVADIPVRYRPRLVLHSHHALVAELGLGGAHLTAAGRAAKARPTLASGQTLSTSFHTLAEIRQYRRRYDYVFLSPIFDSLSKEQYAAAFDLADVAATLRKLRQRAGYAPQVLALGGIEAHRLGAVQQAGFEGAAVLGAVWQSPDPVAAFRALQSIIG